ncbi:MAG TPA: serine hydrolase domain-containing protein [Gemmatimonadaceae bacterium]|nr:serine hydrolase domain-containing protein [Gemmatimonadaceae bacterium]
MRTARIVGLALAFGTVAHGQSLPPKDVAARLIDSLAKDFMTQNGAPSMVLAVVRGSDTIAMGAWGTADREKNIAATMQSIYRVGSVTKQFTSVLVMQLVEQKKVSLDSAIGVYLPALPEKWRRATVTQLLNHTSGIPSYTDVGQRWVSRWGEDMTPATLVELTAKDTMWFEPGTNWKYDNSGYVVLGMLIEKMTGRPWSTEVVERLSKPLGLADTRACDSKPNDPRAAKGYNPQNTSWSAAPYLSMTQPYAAGSMCSTVRDLAAWNRALGTGKVVSAASYAAMTTPVGAASSSNYGFGLMRQSLGSHTVITHGGAVHGFITANAWVPDAELSVTVLTNAANAPAERLLQQSARAALGIPLIPAPRPAPPVVKLTEAERNQYTGVFSLKLPSGARDFTFTDRGGTIFAQLEGQGANALIPYGNHTFGAAFDGTLRITFTVENGKATKLLLQQAGQTIEGTRK